MKYIIIALFLISAIVGKGQQLVPGHATYGTIQSRDWAIEQGIELPVGRTIFVYFQDQHEYAIAYWVDSIRRRLAALQKKVDSMERTLLPPLVIVGAISSGNSDGQCTYDSLGVLIRTESGRCDLIYTVYQDGKWIPYANSRFYNRAHPQSKKQ